jgi:hypothetical protein
MTPVCKLCAIHCNYLFGEGLMLKGEGFCSHDYYIVNHLNALEILLCLIDYAAGKCITPSCCNLQLWLEESSGLSD